MEHQIFRQFPTVILVTVVLCAFAFSQGGRNREVRRVEVHGQIRFSEGGDPAENVLVRLETFAGSMVEQVTTDRMGKFAFSGLAPAQYTVVVTVPGYIDARQQVDAQTTPSAYVMLQLMPVKSDKPALTRDFGAILDAKIPEAARKEYEKGRSALVYHKTPDSGLARLEKAVSLYPQFLEAELLLGATYLDLARWDKAENSLRKVLKINPKITSALFALGELYLQTKKYNEAEQALQNALQLEDTSWHGHLTLGRVYFAMGDLAKAGPEVGRVIQLRPDLAEAHLLAGNILFKARQADKALPLFEEYLKLDPNGRYAAETRGLVEKIKKVLSQW